MTESHSSPEHLERLLDEARAALVAFESQVDAKRLIQRIRTAAPAHPILLIRFVFGAAALVSFSLALMVMAITVVNNDLARTLVKFEAALPLPEALPGLPFMITLFGLCMALGWATVTLSALAVGRDTQMLPWEQKQYQKLVNDVNMLTTQMSVIERNRTTPTGARPRIYTPASLGERTYTPDPLPEDHGDGLKRTPGMTPYGSPEYVADDATPRFAERPHPDIPTDIDTMTPAHDDDPMATPLVAPEPRLFQTPATESPSESTDQGILGSARAGTNLSRSTPIGSAGRIRPAPPAPDEHPTPIGADGLIDAEATVMEEDEAPTEDGRVDYMTYRRLPSWGPIEDDWLVDALGRAEAVALSFPVQAYFEFSQEPKLPFTLVLARAAPPIAIQSMRSFVMFLGNIPAPLRARIELVKVSMSDADVVSELTRELTEVFGSGFSIEEHPGRLDIRFDTPDPRWDTYPEIPIL